MLLKGLFIDDAAIILMKYSTKKTVHLLPNKQ